MVKAPGRGFRNTGRRPGRSNGRNILFWPSPKEALRLAIRKDVWFWVKLPLVLFLAWTFFLPQLWTIGVIAIASIGCAFLIPCPVGEDVRTWHLAAMFMSHIAVVYLVFWYAVYISAFLCRGGWRSKLIAATALLLFPFVLLSSALILGIGFEWVGVPLDPIWAYIDSWTPSIITNP